MIIAALQFSVNKSISKNFETIEKAIIEAAGQNTRLLLTQECSLSGYPPIEIESTDHIDFDEQDMAIGKIMALSEKYDMYVALGLIRRDAGLLKNSIMFISPDGSKGFYDKRALWGWDRDNFSPGENNRGIWEVDGIKIGFRICYEVRFPEYFRELHREKADIAVVSFCDISKEADAARLNIIKAHLQTRAVENVYTVISVNGTTLHQTAPTCVINPDGRVIEEAPADKQNILYYHYEKPELHFGRPGRIHINNQINP